MLALKAGESLRFGINFATARPALGANPSEAAKFAQCTAKHDIPAGTPLLAHMLHPHYLGV